MENFVVSVVPLVGAERYAIPAFGWNYTVKQDHIEKGHCAGRDLFLIDLSLQTRRGHVCKERKAKKSSSAVG